MLKTTSTKRQTRLAGLLGIAASGEADDMSACPPEEALAAFIDNTLPGPERQAMLKHLNSCPDCHYHWLEVAEFAGTQEITPELQPAPAEKPTIRQWLQAWFEPWKLAIPAVVTAVLVMMIAIWPMAPDIGQQIESQYAAADTVIETLAETGQNLPLPWESGALGFIQHEAGPASRSFGTGVWYGRAALNGEVDQEPPTGLLATVSDQSHWGDFYQLGRWMAFLWAAASVEKNNINWDEHRKIAAILRNKIEALPSQGQEIPRAIQELNQIEQMLSEVDTGDARAQKQLVRQLVLAIQLLAPATL